MQVAVTIYGRLAVHHTEGEMERSQSAPIKPCAGSDAMVEQGLLRFQAIAKPEPVAPLQRSTCPSCGGSVKVRGDGSILAHQRPSKRWCQAGIDPTPAERVKAQGRKKGSVWPVTGGLPTLGKGHR